MHRSDRIVGIKCKSRHGVTVRRQCTQSFNCRPSLIASCILTSKYSRPTHVSNELKMSCFWASRTKPCKLDVILVLISIADELLLLHKNCLKPIPVHQKDESEYPVTFSTKKNEIS
ncbi:uncharacterized protein PHALS_05396 [Plasmopara halstedii]|uniref:Uncharacterized protein n=1 Tax=Plasmopara halstedii TaxID=4781 RepID=A0A0P1ABF6_PLAHL|nr:uncharacterized protein PHALS_05396 [Plasmopara halstedii]CEG37617.1 hypothetical protein PHALS_05396 [Plasmopara halstedii]|eukprot:XP_024573986.1 hypothetical protein PHALS_05396 [Plasmopara halstedii]